MNKKELIERMLNKNMRLKCVEEFDFFHENVNTLGIHSCFSGKNDIIHENDSLNITVALSTEFSKEPQFEFNRGRHAVATELKYNKDFIEFSDFLSWFEAAPKRKAGRPPKPKKVDKIVAEIKATKELAEKMEFDKLQCRLDMTLLAEYNSKEEVYNYYNTPHSRAQAVAVSKWVADLEKAGK